MRCACEGLSTPSAPAVSGVFYHQADVKPHRVADWLNAPPAAPEVGADHVAAGCQVDQQAPSFAP
jgi:hypothetical protein